MDGPEEKNCIFFCFKFHDKEYCEELFLQLESYKIWRVFLFKHMVPIQIAGLFLYYLIITY